MSKVVKSVTNAVTSAVKSVVKAVVSVVKAVVNVVADVVNMVVSPFMGLMGGTPDIADSGAAETARQDGVLVQKQGSRENIPIVYGYRKVGGKIIFAETGSTNNQYLWVAYVFSEGCVEGLNEVWLDDNQLSATVVQQLNAGSIVDVPDAKYAGRVRYQWFPGVYFSNPSDSTIGTLSICKDAPSWKSTHTFNGCAVLFARYQWKAVTTQAEADANPFSGSIPVVQVTMMGRRVASLRADAGTDGYVYGGSGYTERYSTNPAEILLDYLRNPRYGKGLNNSDIDWPSFYVAAAKCNQTVTYSNSVTGPALTLNHVVDTNQTLFSVTKALLQNFRGYLPYIQGKYKLKIEDAGHPTDIQSGVATIVHTFNKDNIVGDITYTAIDKNSKYNFVSVNWVDPDQKWSVQQAVYPSDEATRQIYINQDGGRENNLDMTLGGITNSQIALDMARLVFNKSRYQESCSFQASAEAMELEPGDNIYINGNVLAFDGVPWRIVSLKLNNDYTCDIGCVRNPDFIYPYVQANTPDIIAAPYVPTGSTIKAPVVGTTAPVGLYPPSRAPLPDGVSETGNPITNPNPTNPSGPNGGGVGDGSSQQNTNPTGPTNPALSNPLNDVITLDDAAYTYSGDVVYIDLTFRQPTNSQYQSLILWYKPVSVVETVWTQIEILDKIAAGENITARIGPVIGGSAFPAYQLKTRVKYASGEMSKLYSTSVLNTSGSITNQDPTDTPYFIVPGWAVPTTPVAGRRDDILGVLKSVSQSNDTGEFVGDTGGYNAGADMMTFRQSLSGYMINDDIIGIKMYYQATQLPSPAPAIEPYNYWFEYDIDFPSTYVPGQTINIVNPQDWTAPVIPEQPLSFYWNVIFKFKYIDGTYSRKQTRLMNIRHEYTIGEDSFANSTQIIESSTAYSFQPFAQAIHDGAVADPHNMTIGVNTLMASDNINTISMRVFMTVPPAPAYNYLRGFIALVREQGGNGVWTEVIGTNWNPYLTMKGKPVALLEIPLPEYDKYYQVAIMPRVYNPTTRQYEVGNKAVFGQARIHNRTEGWDYPANGDWSPSFNFKQIQAADVRAASNPTPVPIGTPFDVPVISEFNYNWKRSTTQLSWYYDNGTNWVIPMYYSLKLNVTGVAGVTKVHIYRRSRSTSSSVINSGNHYYGTGQFEHIEIPIATLVANDYRVNLRSPLFYTMFKKITTANSAGDTDLLDPTQAVGTDLSYRWWIPESYGTFECYVVLENNTGVCRNAVQLREPTKFAGPQTSADLVVDILNTIGVPPTVTFPGTLNDVENFWRRRTTEAVAPVSWTKLRRIVGGTGPGAGRTFIGVTPYNGPEVI